jgi:hypothetical protein
LKEILRRLHVAALRLDENLRRGTPVRHAAFADQQQARADAALLLGGGGLLDQFGHRWRWIDGRVAFARRQS